MDAIQRELNKDIKDLYEEMRSPEKQEQRAQKHKEQKIIQHNKTRLGL